MAGVHTGHSFGPTILYSRPANGAWSAGTRLNGAGDAVNAVMAGGTGDTVDFA